MRWVEDILRSNNETKRLVSKTVSHSPDDPLDMIVVDLVLRRNAAMLCPIWNFKSERKSKGVCESKGHGQEEQHRLKENFEGKGSITVSKFEPLFAMYTSINEGHITIEIGTMTKKGRT